MSIRMRMFLIIMMLAIVIIIFGLGTGKFFVQNNIETSIEKDMQAIADVSDELISAKINEVKSNARNVAESLADVSEDKYQEVLQECLDDQDQFISLTLLSRDALVAAVGTSPIGPGLIASQYSDIVANDQSLISSTRYNQNGNLVLNVLVPTNGYVLAATIPGMYFSDILKDFTIWETGNIFIDDAEGYVIANIRPEWVQERYNFVQMAQIDSQYQQIGATISEMIKGQPGSGRFSVNDQERLCVYKPITGSIEGWTIGVVAPLQESPLGSLRDGIFLVGAVCLFLSLAAAIIASYILGKPYQEINRLVASLEAQSQDLTRVSEEAVANAEAKSDFLANMSHEMRTPLNAIIGLSELTLDSENMSETARSNLEKVYTSGVTLLSLINDILDISKIDSGKFELNPTEYDTPSLINDTVTLNIVRIGSKLIDFKLDIDHNLPNLLYGDELRIKQVFNNLLSNAFKYTEAGVVTWKITSQDDGDDVWIESSIQDTGSGIKPEDIQKLFSQYNQVDSKSNRKIEGTGLGLSICKSMIELMDGNISVQSEYGKGSIFTVRFKQGKVNDTPIGPSVAENLKNFSYSNNKRDRSAKLVRTHLPYARVLVVDDVPTNLDVARGMMKSYGMQIDCATSGLDAVALIREQKVKYNAIFMDHMMPGMDGIEATRIIREEINTDYARNVPIIALTANAIIGNEDMFLQSGFQAFLSKPIDIMRMDYVINHLVRDKELEKKLASQKGNPDSALTTTKIDVEKRSNKERRSGADRRINAAAKKVIGLDFNQGLSRFDGDQEIYFDVLHSFAVNTLPLLEKMENVSSETLADYAITVHGIKSSSRSIGCDQLGALAEALEHAAKAGDLEFVSANNQEFLDKTKEQIAELNKLLTIRTEQTPKPLKYQPDAKTLSELLEACKNFEVDEVDKAIKDLEKYSYQTQGELVEWLRSQVNVLGFKQIQERLSEL